MVHMLLDCEGVPETAEGAAPVIGCSGPLLTEGDAAELGREGEGVLGPGEDGVFGRGCHPLGSHESPPPGSK